MNIKKVLTVGALALALTACGSGSGNEASSEAVKTGTATAEGYAGDIEVTVGLDEAGKIVSVERKSDETPDKGEVALDEVEKNLIGKESADDIENVSGATVSVDAYKEALDEAIKNAE